MLAWTHQCAHTHTHMHLCNVHIELHPDSNQVQVASSAFVLAPSMASTASVIQHLCVASPRSTACSGVKPGKQYHCTAVCNAAHPIQSFAHYGPLHSMAASAHHLSTSYTHFVDQCRCKYAASLPSSTYIPAPQVSVGPRSLGKTKQHAHAHKEQINKHHLQGPPV